VLTSARSDRRQLDRSWLAATEKLLIKTVKQRFLAWRPFSALMGALPTEPAAFLGVGSGSRTSSPMKLRRHLLLRGTRRRQRHHRRYRFILTAAGAHGEGQNNGRGGGPCFAIRMIIALAGCGRVTRFVRGREAMRQALIGANSRRPGRQGSPRPRHYEKLFNDSRPRPRRRRAHKRTHAALRCSAPLAYCRGLRWTQAPTSRSSAHTVV